MKSIYSNPKFKDYLMDNQSEDTDRKAAIKAFVGLFCWAIMMAIIWFYLIPLIPNL